MTPDMYDLSIKPLADGAFELSQLAGSLDEPSMIHLHPLQVRFIAERAGVLSPPDPKLIDRLSANHIRRVRILRERVDELGRGYYSEIMDRCGSGFEIVLHLRALDELTEEMFIDLGISPEPTPPENERPAASPATGAELPLPQTPAQPAKDAGKPKRDTGAAVADLLTVDPAQGASQAPQREQPRTTVPA